MQDASAPVLDQNQNQGLKGREEVRVCFPSSYRERVSPSIFRVLCSFFECSYVPWIELGQGKGILKALTTRAQQCECVGAGQARADRWFVCVCEREERCMRDCC